MNSKLEKLLPESIKYRLIAWSSIYHFNQEKEGVPARIQVKLKDISQKKYDPVLFSGYIKSGNTWLRFLIFNYFNLLQKADSKTLSYSELNHIQSDQLNALDEKSLHGPKPHFPYIIRTHEHYREAFQVFNKCIYIYRNPLDTLVSAYYFRKKHADLELGFEESRYTNPIDHFVRYNLKLWELHIQSYQKAKGVLTLKYEDLHHKPLEELKKVIEHLGYPFDENLAQKSVQLSSFQNIQKMGREKNEQFGNGGTQFTGEFTRKGLVGGYKDELQTKTIEAAKPYFSQYGFHFDS
jgi:hypothetical protein